MHSLGFYLLAYVVGVGAFCYAILHAWKRGGSPEMQRKAALQETEW